MNIREHLEAAMAAAREQGNTVLADQIKAILDGLDSGATAQSGGGTGNGPPPGP